MPSKLGAAYPNNATLNQRLWRQLGLVSLALVLITVGSATLVVRQLNARDLARIHDDGDVQLGQIARHLETFQARYLGLMQGLQQDTAMQAAVQAPTPQGISQLLSDLMHRNPLVHEATWTSPQGQVLVHIGRTQTQPSASATQALPHLGQAAWLKAAQHEGGHVWVGAWEPKPTDRAAARPLFNLAQPWRDASGQSRGVLMLGVDLLAFIRAFQAEPDQTRVPVLQLLNAQGQDLLQLAKQVNTPALSDALLVELTAKPQGHTDQGQMWRRMAPVPSKAPALVSAADSPALTLLLTTPASTLASLRQHNLQLVTAIWGSGLACLGVAMALMYRRTRQLNEGSARETRLRRVARIGYWRYEFKNKTFEASPDVWRLLAIDKPQEHNLSGFLSTIENPSQRQRFTEGLYLGSQGHRIELEVPCMSRSGALVWSAIFGTPYPQEGQAQWLDGMVQDVTARKEAEMAATAFREYVRNIVDWARLGVWEYDLVNNQRRINTYLRDMLGRTFHMTQEYELYNWAPDAHPDDIPAATQAQLDYLAGKTPYFSAKLRIKHADGHWVWLALEGQNVAFDDLGKPLIMRGTAVDVSELQEARQTAELANRAKNKFLSSMSHELRTPLNSILGYGQLIQMGNKLDVHDQEHLNAILSGGRHLLNLVNDLLQITRDEAARVAVDITTVNLSDVCYRTCIMLSPLANERGISIKSQIFGVHEVLADALRLQQVVINVMANAIKYSAEKSTVKLMVAKLNGGMLRLTIEDQGPGIAPQVGQQVFEAFYRGHTPGQSHEGAGIGLTVSLRLMEQMNGRLSYDSTEGVGSAFHIDLPTPDTAEFVPESAAGPGVMPADAPTAPQAMGAA